MQVVLGLTLILEKASLPFLLKVHLEKRVTAGVALSSTQGVNAIVKPEKKVTRCSFKLPLLSHLAMRSASPATC